jgi:hypothetical protein
MINNYKKSKLPDLHTTHIGVQIRDILKMLPKIKFSDNGIPLPFRSFLTFPKKGERFAAISVIKGNQPYLTLTIDFTNSTIKH